MSALVFTVQGDNLVVEVMPSSKGTVGQVVDGITVNFLNPTKFGVSMANKRPIQILSDLKDQFSNLLIFGGQERFDDVVRDIAQKFTTGDVSNTTMRKGYAKYFYETLINRNTKALVRDGGLKETALIVTELLSWYFIRRAVHIYVVCTILDKVKGMSQAAAATSASTYQVIAPTAPASAPASSMANAEAAKKNVEALQKQLSNVQSQLLSSGADKTTITAQLAAMQNTITDMTAQMTAKDNQLLACQEQNNRLATELENFKELLLSSTSMIFKMDEIPNL